METLYIKKATDLDSVLVHYCFWNENMILYQETRELWSGAGFVLLNPMFKMKKIFSERISNLIKFLFCLWFITLEVYGRL